MREKTEIFSVNGSTGYLYGKVNLDPCPTAQTKSGQDDYRLKVKGGT